MLTTLDLSTPSPVIKNFSEYTFPGTTPASRLPTTVEECCEDDSRPTGDGAHARRGRRNSCDMVVSLAKRQVSFRLTVSMAGAFFVLITGIGPSTLSVYFNTQVVTDVSEALRAKVIETVASKVLATTEAVHTLTWRGGKGIFNADGAASNFGCCSAADDAAMYVENYPAVRRFHWQNLETNRYVLLSFSGTMAGSILLLAKTGNHMDIDGTQGRKGMEGGNFQWTISDATTNYSYHQYYSNVWEKGGPVKVQSSLCGTGFIQRSGSMLSTAYTTKAECDSAAAELFEGVNESIEIRDGGEPQGCWRHMDTGKVFWNPSGDPAVQVPRRHAVCEMPHWFPRRDVFEPTCAHEWPCHEGQFVQREQTGFNETLFEAREDPYNATQRSWYKGAVSKGRLSDDRTQPTWANVYLSKSTGQLVLPSVLPLYVGATDTVRGVITLGIGLQFLDKFLEDQIDRIHVDAKGWIVDLGSGKLIASSPTGLSTTGNAQTNVMDVGQVSKGKFIQAVSAFILEQIGGDWMLLKRDDSFFEFETDEFPDETLVQARKIVDGHGLQWLVVITVPKKVFFEKLWAAENWTIVATCAMTIIGASLLFWISCRISNHIQRLGEMMSKVSRMHEMDMDAEETNALTSMYSEIGSMAASFKKMSFNLKKYWKQEQDEIQKQRLDHERRQKNRIEAAIKEADELRHPMVVCMATDFINSKRLTSYEELRDLKLRDPNDDRESSPLVVLDTMAKIEDFENENIIIFFSHQWLDWRRPDPDNVHHRTMCNAIKQLQLKFTKDGRSVELRDMYIWCDYSSISQEHRGMQILAISSLPVYSAKADAFVVIAPPAENSSGQMCDLRTYDQRGWCRVETLFKVCVSGLDNMFVMRTEEDLEPLTMEIFEKNLSLRVFEVEAHYSCCQRGHIDSPYCDKEKLVESVLGMYHHLLTQVNNNTQPHWVLEQILKERDAFFPSRFRFYTEHWATPEEMSEARYENRALFADLVPLMDLRVAEDKAKAEEAKAMEEREMRPQQESVSSVGQERTLGAERMVGAWRMPRSQSDSATMERNSHGEARNRNSTASEPISPSASQAHEQEARNSHDGIYVRLSESNLTKRRVQPAKMTFDEFEGVAAHS